MSQTGDGGMSDGDPYDRDPNIWEIPEEAVGGYKRE